MMIILGVVLVCGLPGAGKGSLIEAFLHLRENSKNGVVPTTTTVIEYDRVQAEQPPSSAAMTIAASSVVPEVDDAELQAWRQSRRVALERLAQQIGSLASAAAQDSQSTQDQYHLIFLDDNFYLRSMRKQVYQTCQEQLRLLQPTNHSDREQLEIRLGVVWLDTALDMSLTRNSQRPQQRQVSNHVIHRMNARFEPPSPTSPLVWERQSFVRLDGTSNCCCKPVPEQLHDFATTLLRPDYSYSGRVVVLDRSSPEELQQQQLETARATAADRFWRRCVTVTVQVLGRSWALQANQVRRHCLEQQQQQQQRVVTCCCESEWLNRFLQGLGENDQDWLTLEQKNVLRQAVLPSNNLT